VRAALETVPDVGRGQGRVHPLGGMRAFSVCALLCGSRSLYAIAQWQDCGPEIRAALGLRAERGPRAPTLQRAFRALDHAACERVVTDWFAAPGLEAEEALDGKTLRGIHGAELPGVPVVAAFARQTRGALTPAETRGNGHERARGEAALAQALLASRALSQQRVAKGGRISSC
jgi:hypothetical protein